MCSLNRNGGGGRAPKSFFNAALREAFAAFGRHRLTQREGEVVSLVLRGHSSEAIASELKIAAGTVKIHRKNIYAKLGIGSQAELFSLFLASLSDTRAQIPTEASR